MIRQPAVAGRFYPGDRGTLLKFLAQSSAGVVVREKALGVVAPHAGYVYSGMAAGKVFAGVEITPTVLLLGPNHTGRGTRASIMGQGAWRTPLGDVPIDGELAHYLKTHCPTLAEDTDAHAMEHSLEVELPFLQYGRPDVKIVPIAFMLRRAEVIEEVGRQIGRALKKRNEPVLIVASSDMTHYETAESARQKDGLAIERILALDPTGLMEVVIREKITMCGVVPAAVMLYAALEMGATAAKKIVYTNSGETSGDFNSVVGYAGLTVY